MQLIDVQDAEKKCAISDSYTLQQNVFYTEDKACMRGLKIPIMYFIFGPRLRQSGEKLRLTFFGQCVVRDRAMDGERKRERKTQRDSKGV